MVLMLKILAKINFYYLFKWLLSYRPVVRSVQPLTKYFTLQHFRFGRKRMNSMLCLLAGFIAIVASEPQTQEKFFGGIFGGGNSYGNSQCYNCQYDLAQASYCCRQNLDTRCCRYGSGVGGESYYPGSYTPGGIKSGSCPFNAGYNSYNSYNGVRVKREEAPWASRYYTGGVYNNDNYGYNNNYNNNGYQRDECYSDYQCPGRAKCCQNFGFKQCAEPMYSASG